jgi:hypothetical protein
MVSNDVCSHEDLTEEFTQQLAVSGTATTRREDVLLGMYNRDVILMLQDEVCKMHVLGMRRDTRCEQGSGEREVMLGGSGMLTKERKGINSKLDMTQ